MAKPPEGLRAGVPLAPLTSYRIGGPARWYCEAQDRGGLDAALAWAEQRGAPGFLLGAGTNLLVDDDGFDGLVVKLAGTFAEIRRKGNLLVAGGGAKLVTLVSQGLEAGSAGFLKLAGIPGSVGGAVRMNAGTREGELSELLRWADIRLPNGQVRRLTGQELDFAYRACHLLRAQPRAVVLEAAFDLSDTDGAPPALAQELHRRNRERAARQPKGHSCGSVFKNPYGPLSGGTSAGQLIEEAGCKGWREGRAVVSAQHANWIVNEGDATAADVKALIERMRVAVEESSGVRLELEVLIV